MRLSQKYADHSVGLPAKLPLLRRELNRPKEIFIPLAPPGVADSPLFSLPPKLAWMFISESLMKTPLVVVPFQSPLKQ